MRLLTMLKRMIRRATVTEAYVDYVGSITFDLDLIERSGLLPNELVHVCDRYLTYDHYIMKEVSIH